MIKRTVEISTEGHFLSIKNDQLVIERQRELISTIPCEDIGVLIIDSKATVYTHDVLVRTTHYGAVVVLCGDDHLPAGMMLPMVANTIQTERLAVQVGAKLPLKKRLWQQIVQAKIRMQASALPEDHQVRAVLSALVPKVRSGDPDNLEAQAARLYWPAVFADPKFRRLRTGPPPNNLLNYGYMAVRAAVARAACGAGLHPSLGLSHHNKYDPFCLADDLMEPFRPLVDIRVARLWSEGKRDICQETKRALLTVLTDQVNVGGETGPLMVALHKTAASLVKCLAGEEEKLALPQP
jgi:CRISPR-associated protein Cas1